VHELRQEGQEENRGFRVERLGTDRLEKRLAWGDGR